MCFHVPLFFLIWFHFLLFFLMFFHFVLFFSLEKTITKLDLLQFDTLFSFAESKLFYFYPMHIEQPPRGPGCMMVPKSLPFCIVLPLMCQKGSRTILQIDANFAVTSFGGFLNWGNPQVSSILMGLSLTKTIQLLGYPHSQETSICGRSPPRILAAHHRASTSPSGGS